MLAEIWLDLQVSLARLSRRCHTEVSLFVTHVALTIRFLLMSLRVFFLLPLIYAG